MSQSDFAGGQIPILRKVVFMWFRGLSGLGIEGPWASGLGFWFYIGLKCLKLLVWLDRGATDVFSACESWRV